MCLPSEASCNTYRLTWVSLTLDVGYLFTAWDLASITIHIHNCVLFLLWLHPFILSRVISPLISSSILGTYRPGEFLFQYPIILPFHTIHGVLKARILKWFATILPGKNFFPYIRLCEFSIHRLFEYMLETNLLGHM